MEFPTLQSSRNIGQKKPIDISIYAHPIGIFVRLDFLCFNTLKSYIITSEKRVIDILGWGKTLWDKRLSAIFWGKAEGREDSFLNT